jgi:hypothetical protein
MRKFKNKYIGKLLKNALRTRRHINYVWVAIITIAAFFISIVFSLFSETVISNVSTIFGILVIILFIMIGIITDMIGIAVAVADLKTFNSMATKKIRGSKTAIKLMKNSSKVSSFFNDVIGDICGIISGSAGVSIAIQVANKHNFNVVYSTLIVTSLIAALTIGGKAMGKGLAIKKGDVILYRFAKLISPFVE